MSLPANTDSVVNCIPVTCMPSPESPAKRMTTFSRSCTGFCRGAPTGFVAMKFSSSVSPYVSSDEYHVGVMKQPPAPYPTFSTITSSVPLGAQENAHICRGLQKAKRKRQDRPHPFARPPPRRHLDTRRQARERGQTPKRRRFGNTLNHHRPLGRETRAPLGFRQGFLNATHIVNQPAGPGLSAAPDPTLRAGLDCLRGQGTTVRNFLDKVLVESPDLKVQPLNLRRSKRHVIREQGGALATRENFLAHAKTGIEITHHRLAGDHPDRAGDRTLFGKDLVSSQGQIIPA